MFIGARFHFTAVSVDDFLQFLFRRVLSERSHHDSKFLRRNRPIPVLVEHPKRFTVFYGKNNMPLVSHLVLNSRAFYQVKPRTLFYEL